MHHDVFCVSIRLLESDNCTDRMKIIVIIQLFTADKRSFHFDSLLLKPALNSYRLINVRTFTRDAQRVNELNERWSTFKIRALHLLS